MPRIDNIININSPIVTGQLLHWRLGQWLHWRRIISIYSRGSRSFSHWIHIEYTPFKYEVWCIFKEEGLNSYCQMFCWKLYFNIMCNSNVVVDYNGTKTYHLVQCVIRVFLNYVDVNIYFCFRTVKKYLFFYCTFIYYMLIYTDIYTTFVQT